MRDIVSRKKWEGYYFFVCRKYSCSTLYPIREFKKIVIINIAGACAKALERGGYVPDRLSPTCGQDQFIYWQLLYKQLSYGNCMLYIIG